MNFDLVNPRWLRYWLSSPEFSVQSFATKGATDMADFINLRDQRRMRITLPPISVQRKVSYVLECIDDLVEKNSRRIELLEQMAQAIYREWFVHFRYPGHEDVSLAESPLGPIPEGWTVLPIKFLVDIVVDSVIPGEVDPHFPAVGLEHIPRKKLTLDSWGMASDMGSRKTAFRRGDILFSKIRPYYHKVSIAPFDGICSTDAIVIRPCPNYYGQVAMVLSSRDFIEYAVQTSNGTKMPRANWGVIGEHLVPVPPEWLAYKFTQKCSEIFEKCQLLMLANHHLAAIRDLLLPKLMTGQIDVSTLDLDGILEADE